MRLRNLFFSVGPDVPFVAVYKTQRDGESETQAQESECAHTFTTVSIMLKTLQVTL